MCFKAFFLILFVLKDYEDVDDLNYYQLYYWKYVSSKIYLKQQCGDYIFIYGNYG